MVIRTTRRNDLARLAESLHALPGLVEFEIVPGSD